MVKEIFKKHQCGLWVSNIGRVWFPISKNHPEHITFGTNGKKDCKGNFYKVVRWKGKNISVHRLVAEVFIPNPDNLPYIDHIDRNPSNNRVENLRWVTPKGNCENRDLFNNCGAKVVLQYTKSGEFVREWPSIQEVKRTLGYNQGHISQCCNRIRKSAYNYIWKYK